MRTGSAGRRCWSSSSGRRAPLKCRPAASSRGCPSCWTSSDAWCLRTGRCFATRPPEPSRPSRSRWSGRARRRSSPCRWASRRPEMRRPRGSSMAPAPRCVFRGWTPRLRPLLRGRRRPRALQGAGRGRVPTTVLAKLYSEAIEAIDPGRSRLCAAGGGGRSGAPLGHSPPAHAAVPLVHALPIRDQYSGASRGFVGAGGIGFYIQNYLRTLNYPAASTVLLVLIALVMLVDFVSSRLRARLV